MVTLVKKEWKTEREKEIEREHQSTNSWIPEKNAVTGFTFKGMGMLILLVIIVLVVKYILNLFGSI